MGAIERFFSGHKIGGEALRCAVYYKCADPVGSIDVLKQRRQKDLSRRAISTTLNIKKTCITGFLSRYRGNKGGCRGRGAERWSDRESGGSPVNSHCSYSRFQVDFLITDCSSLIPGKIPDGYAPCIQIL